MNIDWEDIEERLAYLEDKPDCIPEDIREWTKFREQYENALEWMKDWKDNDFSKPNMTKNFLNKKTNEIACLGYGFKKSIFEVFQDNKTDLIPELDWETIENFKRFFNWDINLNFKKIKSLPPLPKYVGGDFDCIFNQLTTLEGAPQHVSRNFKCHTNQLTTLEGAPQHVGGYFYCYNNQLTTLEGAPQHVGKNFYCSQNKLTSLEGAPQHVGGYFYCDNNQLTTLEGAPQHVGKNFYCDNNNLPKSIPHKFPGKDLPKYINLKESLNNLKHIKTFEAFVWTDTQDKPIDGLYMTTPKEKLILDLLDSHGLIVDGIARRSNKEYDLKVVCDITNLGIDSDQAAEFGTPTKDGSGVICWLPLVCINQFIKWETPEIANKTDWPELVGDFDAIKMSGEETIWKIFKQNVLIYIKDSDVLPVFNKNQN